MNIHTFSRFISKTVILICFKLMPICFEPIKPKKADIYENAPVKITNGLKYLYKFLSVISYFLFIIFYLLFLISYLLFIISYLFTAYWRISGVNTWFWAYGSGVWAQKRRIKIRLYRTLSFIFYLYLDPHERSEHIISYFLFLRIDLRAFRSSKSIFKTLTDMVLLYQLTLELLLYLIHDNVDFTLFYCVRLKLDSRFNLGINIIQLWLFTAVVSVYYVTDDSTDRRYYLY